MHWVYCVSLRQKAGQGSVRGDVGQLSMSWEMWAIGRVVLWGVWWALWRVVLWVEPVCTRREERKAEGRKRRRCGTCCGCFLSPFSIGAFTSFCHSFCWSRRRQIRLRCFFPIVVQIGCQRCRRGWIYRRNRRFYRGM